jgi:hypothetical protein
MATALPNANINIPYSAFLDENTGRPSQPWLQWLLNPSVISINLGSALGVTSGGTGLTTIPANGQLLIGNGTGYTLNTLGFGAGISVTNGSGTISVANTGVLSFSAGTTGLTPSTATTGVVSLAGTLIALNGGTGFSSYAVGDLLYANTTTTLAKLPDVATGNALISGGVSTAPTWGKIGLTTHVSGILPIANGGTGATTKAAAFNALSPMSTAGDVIYGGVSGAGTALAIGAAGQVLTVNSGATAPQWSTPTTGTVTSVSGTGTVSGISLSGTVTSSGSLTLGGTLDLSSPPAIGSTSASTGAFTTLSASSTVSGAGFSTYLASPPAIGGTAAAAGTFTTLTATGQTSLGGVTGSEGLRVNSVAGSTNWLDVTGSSANRVDVTALGPAGSNVALRLSSRGSQPVNLYTVAQTVLQFSVASTASAVNYVQVTGGTTVTKTVTASAQGSDTDVDFALVPKGAGRVTISTSIKPKVNSAASVTSPLAWNSTSYDEYAITALANALTISADANTAPADGQRMMFRFKDNGTAQTLTWTTGSARAFRVVGVTLPTTTVASKLLYVGCIYNAADSRWDAIAVGQEA